MVWIATFCQFVHYDINQIDVGLVFSIFSAKENKRIHKIAYSIEFELN